MKSARKLPAIIIPAVLLAVLAAQFTACEKYVLPDLHVSPDTLRFTAATDSQTVTVTTNVITTLYAESSDNWVSASPDWIDSGTPVLIRVAENTGPESRTATIPVKSESILRNLVVIQEGAEAEPDTTQT